MHEFGDAGYSDGQNTFFSDGQNASSSLDFSARGSSPSSLAECETFDTIEINKLTPGQFLFYWVKEVHHVTSLPTLKPRFGRFDGIVYSNPRTVLLVEFRNDKYWVSPCFSPIHRCPRPLSRAATAFAFLRDVRNSKPQYYLFG